MPKYNEQWIVNINRKEFVIDGNEKLKLEYAMKNGDRWFKISSGDIISVSHIECVTLHSKEIANQLPEGEKEEENILSPEELHKRLLRIKTVRINPTA